MLFWLSYSMLWAVALLQLVGVLVLVHKLELLRVHAERRTGASDADLRLLPEGTDAPSFSAVRLDSSRTLDSSEFHGQAIFLLFLSVTCLDCRKIIEGLNAEGPDALTGLVIYCLGDRSRCSRHLGALATTVPILIEGEPDLMTVYQISAVPMGVTIDAEWRIRGSLSPSSAKEVTEHLEELRRQLGARGRNANGSVLRAEVSAAQMSS